MQLHKILYDCAEYLKEGETPAECIARNREDCNSALGMVAQERLRVETLTKSTVQKVERGGTGGTEAMIWRTIDSVPKDGSAVVLCNAIDADGDLIDWQEDPHTAGVFVQVASWWAGEGWVVYCSMVRDPQLHFEPTHWMPLPAPPEEQKP